MNNNEPQKSNYKIPTFLVRFFSILIAIYSFSVMSKAYAECREPNYRTKTIFGERELIVTDGNGREEQLYSRSIAFLIGESKYTGGKTGLRPLASVPREISNLRQALESHGFEVWTYLDLDSKELQSTLECFFKEKLPADDQMRFLLWFAGHGITLRDGERHEGYVLPLDIVRLKGKEPEPTEIRQKGLRLSQFVEWAANGIRAKHALFVFDSCFAGSVLSVPTRSGTNKNESPKPLGYAISAEAQKPLREFLTSGTEDQEVPASSLFADYFVKALLGQRREADVNSDGLLTGTELLTFMKETISQENVTQTPTSGRLNHSGFNRGELVFKLPEDRSKRLTKKSELPPLVNSGGIRPVFRGSIDSKNDSSSSIVHFFEADAYLTTTATECADNCEMPDKSKDYELVVRLPEDAPAGSMLDAPELRCISGLCEAGGKVLKGPVLSPDRQAASVVIRGWGPPSIWRLAARLVIAKPGSGAAVVDRRSGTLQEVAAKSIAISSNTPEVNINTETNLRVVLDEIQSNDTQTRRAARLKLARIMETVSPQVITQLVRKAPISTYRYQLGVSEALGNVKNGWLTEEAASRPILQKLYERPGQDPTLKKSLQNALLNQRLFAYYETGDNGWLTKDGQLRKKGEIKAPLTAFNALKPGDVLIADSAVNLRSGVGLASGVVKTANTGACLSVIQSNSTDSSSNKGGGWLHVRELPGCNISKLRPNL